jgi:hypothetical protein
MNQYVTRPTLADRPRSPTGNAARDLVAKFSFRVVVFLLLHLPLALALKQSPTLSLAHALFTFAVGLFWLAKDKRPDRLIYLTAYVAGAEMLWRVTYAFEDIFWEFGKYAVSLLLILAILKQHRLSRADKKPVLYFALLLPSVFVLPAFDRQEIAFNLTGPLSLAVATMFFSTVKLTRFQMERVLFAILAPIIGLAFLASHSTLSTESIAFTPTESIEITAGGTATNQVSTILGLGALVAFLYAATSREHGFLRMLMVGCTIWLGAQGALTFSRGGFLAALGAIAVAAFYLLRDRRSRGIFLLRGIGVLLVSLYVAFPALNDFTGGTLAPRYSDFDLTGRDTMIKTDLLAFRENPLFGVGPGRSKAYHAILHRWADTHTELSRMLAEHGSLGLLALLVLLTMSLGPVRKPLPSLEKAYTVSFTVWALLTMLHSAMRLVAPSFAFGLASATMLFKDTTSDYE